MKKKASIAEENVEVVMPAEAGQEAKDSEGADGTTMAAIERIIAQSEPKKAVEKAVVVTKVSKQKKVVAKALASMVNKARASSSEEGAFDLRHLAGGELNAEGLSELREFVIAGGYKPGAILFGGVDEELLECVPDGDRARVVNTLTKSIGFPKLEDELRNYRKHHITGSLVY